MSELNNKNEMAPKPSTKSELELRTQILQLRNEKENLVKKLNEREELMTSLFSYLQNFPGKGES
jgi:hypothetical protein